MSEKIFNKKTLILGVVTVLVVAISAICALIPVTKSHARKANAWLSEISDSTKICDLSIPGTHDSGATHSIFDVAGKCQDLSIKSQLNIGVRFLDLRLQLINDKFQIVHSFVKQNLTFESVVLDMKNFLTQNPSEFLIISIKQEQSSVNSTLKFETALLNELKPANEIINFTSILPETVGEIRGKILIISRYSNSTVGIPAHSGWIDDDCFELGDLYVQDNYSIDEIQDKKQSVQTALNYAKSSNGKLVLNFSSCYLNNAFPPSYAGTSALEINPWLLEYLGTNNGKTGIIVADFITEKLAKAIYGRNFK